MEAQIDIGGHDPRGLHIDQYFGVWAIHEETFRAAFDRVRGLDLAAHIAANRGVQTMESVAADYRYTLHEGGVAQINVTGTLMKFTSSLADGSSTAMLRKTVRNAVRDEAVNSILLVIDSPGGTVRGTQDLADEIARANAVKPVTAYIEDIGASGAYWVASQASKIFTNATALVGSIGTFTVMQDMSAAAAMEGVKVHVIRAGEMKGAGMPGTEVTGAQMAEAQRMVDSLNEFFIEGIARGRRMAVERVRELADGRVHIGAEAQAVGLTDGVKQMSDVIAAMRGVKIKSASKSAARMETKMSDTEAKETAPSATVQAVPIPATVNEIRAACAGADSDFIVAQLSANATLDDARSAWIAKQAEQNAALQKEIETARTAKPGVPGLVDRSTAKATDTSGASASDQWHALIGQKIAAGMSKPRAIASAVRENPDLHTEYLAEYNQAHGGRIPA